MKHRAVRDMVFKLALSPKQWVKGLGGLMPSTSQRLIVVTLDGQWLKLLQVDGPARTRQITRVQAAPIEGLSPDELAKIFKEATAGDGQAPADVLVANPTHLSTVRLFSLPSTDATEIRDIVELQAEKHTPYAKEEILSDFTVIERDRSGYSRVLLVIAHQDVIERSVRLVESAGFVLDRVGCELEGLLNWFLLMKRASGGAPAGPSLIVDVDGATTTLLVVEHRQLQFHRSLATGAEHLQEHSAQAGERLVGELTRSIEALDAEGKAVKLSEIILTGRTDRLGVFKEQVERGLNLPVTLLPPWPEQAMSEAARAGAERLPDVSFASLAGIGLAPSRIDLTPKAAKLRHAFEAKAKALVTLGCQSIGALILVTLLIISRAHREQRYYQALREVYQQSVSQADEVEQALRQIALVEVQLRDRGRLLEAAETLTSQSSPDIRWQSLTYNSEEGIVLKGTTTELPKVYEYVASLDASPVFGQVEARRVSKRKGGDEQSLTDFEIVCPFSTPTTEAGS